MTFYDPYRLLILKRESFPLRRNLASETTATDLRGDGQSFDHLHQQNAVLAGVFKVHGVREGGTPFPRTNMNPLQVACYFSGEAKCLFGCGACWL